MTRSTTIVFLSALVGSLVSALVSLPSWAQDSEFKVPANSAASTLSTTKPSQFQMRAELQYSSYINSGKTYFAEEEKAAQMTTVGLGFFHDGYGPGSRTHVDGRWFYSEAEGEHYFDIRELSYRVERKSAHNTWIGRHREEWSFADEFWQLGMWQPRFSWDKLRPEVNGLTGVFYHPVLPPKWDGFVFVSPMYIPEMGPNYKEENNTIVSRHPWFRTPPPLLELFDQPTELTARVDEPPYADILFRPSFGLHVVRDLSREEKLKISYAFKPMNQLLTAFDYKLIPRDGDWTADFTFRPLVTYHHITSLAYHRGNAGWEADLSWTYDSAILEERPAVEIAQNREDMHMYSAVLTKKLDGRSRSATRIYSGILHVEGFVAADRGENAQDETLFEYIPKYFQAVKVGVSRTSYRRLTDRYGQKMGLEATYDHKQKGGVFMAEYALSPMVDMQLSFKLDLLGLMTEEETGYEKGFVSSFRANDRLQMDVSYVF